MTRALFWAPRALSILFIGFVSLFALDVFQESFGFWQILVALTIHLIPSFFMLAALVMAWRWEWVGTVLFGACGIFFAVIVRAPWLGKAMFAVPCLLTAWLFYMNWRPKAGPGRCLVPSATGKIAFRWIAANTLAWTVAGGMALPLGGLGEKIACGAIVGTAQWLALRGRVGAPLAWIAVTCIGWALGDWAGQIRGRAFTLTELSDLLTGSLPSLMIRFTYRAAAASGALVGAAQMWILWHRVSRPALWLPATAAGCLLGWLAGVRVGFWINDLGWTSGAFWSGGAAIGIIAGAVSAPVLVMMLRPGKSGWPQAGNGDQAPQKHNTMKRRFWRFAAVVLIAALSAGCSIKKIAVNKLGNTLASGGSTFESDDDPDLVGEALPFALKLMESLLAESPRHQGLLLATASGFTEYSYAFVALRAERAFTENVEESSALRARSRRLYLRAHGYGMRALEARYPGIRAAIDNDQAAALNRVRKRDVPLLYWTAAAHGLAISASKNDPEMIAQLPVVEAFLTRAVELDPGWKEGALPEVLISIEATHSGTKPAAQMQAAMRARFEEALRLSGGKRASLFVSYAENACIPAQDRAQFKELLEQALRVEPDRQPESRLANLISQRRARWLLARTDELFLEPAQ